MQTTMERPETPVTTETPIPSVIRERYEGYRITPLWSNRSRSYFRATKWGIDFNGDPCILRSRFIEMRNGEMIEH